MIGSTAVVLLAAMPRARVLGAATGALIIAGFLALAGWQFSGGVAKVIPDPARAAVEGRVEVRDALRIVVEDDYAISERLAQWETGVANVHERSADRGGRRQLRPCLCQA